jgi:hypothetical protein
MYVQYKKSHSHSILLFPFIFPFVVCCLLTVNRDRLDDPWMLYKAFIHPGLSDVRHLLAAPERAHRAVFLQSHGILRGGDLPAIVESE